MLMDLTVAWWKLGATLEQNRNLQITSFEIRLSESVRISIHAVTNSRFYNHPHLT